MIHGGSPLILGGWGEKSCRQNCARHVGKQNGHETGPRESSECAERHIARKSFEAKPFVTTGGRQTPYFVSKRPVSGSTFSASFFVDFSVPLTHETIHMAVSILYPSSSEQALRTGQFG